jgi:hypothetical protein
LDDDKIFTFNDLLNGGYKKDPLFNRILEALRKKNKKSRDISLSEYSEYGRPLYFRNKLYILYYYKFKLYLINQIYNNLQIGHSGRNKIYKKFFRNYFWTRINKDIIQYIRYCYICRRIKASKKISNGIFKLFPVPERRWKDVSINFVIGLPSNKNLWGISCKNIIVVTDRLTKKKHYICYDNMDIEIIAKLYYRYIWKIYRLPDIYISNRGTQFFNYFWKYSCRRFDIRKLLSISYYPKTDGQTENININIKYHLRYYIDYTQDNWVKLFFETEFVANNHEFASTDIIFFFANKKFHPRIRFEPPIESEKFRNLISKYKINTQSAKQFTERINKILKFCKNAIYITQARQKKVVNKKRIPAPAYRVTKYI